MDKAASAGHSDRCRIVVDTCCDFSPEVAANLDVDILGFPFIIDGEERTDDIWSSITPKEFYDRMRAGARVSTSAVSLGRYIEFFTECAKEGTPTVYLCFTSALSSSYNSACQAADAVRAEYPNFELYVVDNALPCATGELLALEAVRQRSAGLTAKQLVDWANEAKTYVHGYFTLESFDALAAGGRIPPAAAQLTAKLDVKPELSYDLAGSLSLIGVNRGRKKALKSILKSFRENYVPDRTMPIAIMTADAEKDGRVVVLPCKVGDTVWAILDGAKYARECKVDFVNIGSFGTTIVFVVKDGLREQYGVTAAAFGKTVFLTRKEAEKALEAKE